MRFRVVADGIASVSRLVLWFPVSGRAGRGAYLIGARRRRTTLRVRIRQEVVMATKDKNAKKTMAKKPAQKTLKEKRQAKRDKR